MAVVGVVMTMVVGVVVPVIVALVPGTIGDAMIVMMVFAVDMNFIGAAAASCAHGLYSTSSSFTRISVPPVTCT